MSIAWKYPIQVVQHSGGFVSLVDPTPPEGPQQALVAFESEATALEFMQRYSILGVPRALNNDREFAWLLESFEHPVIRVAFEPDPVEDDFNSRWQATIESLLEEHLTPDNSPWDYPAYVVAVETGFASIRFPDDLGEMQTAIILFTSKEKAEACIEECHEGTPCELADAAQTKTFLTAIADVVDAVAIDPVMDEGNLGTKHCFLLKTLLTKYFA